VAQAIQSRPRPAVPANPPPGTLKVAAYDRVASLLIALLILIGLAVVILFAMWISNQIWVTQQAIPVIMEGPSGGREDGVLGESLQIDSPDPEEIAKETDLVEPMIQETVAQVLDAVAVIQTDLDDPQITEEIETGGKGRSEGTGNQVGLGSGGGPGSGFPREQRWVIQYKEGGTLQSYAEQLDFFKIELGAIGNTNQVQYARNLSKPTPDKRVGPGDQEKRLYFNWKDGNLKQADTQLLKAAGINVTPRTIIVQFFDPETENLLAYLELQYAKRDAKEIRRTRFGVRAGKQGKKYEFYVIDQTYLR
jgi:hypothetical protein